MPPFIIEYGVKTAFAVAVGVLSFAVKNLYQRMKQTQAERQSKVAAESMEQQLIKEGVLAILHDKVYSLCKRYIARGEVTVQDLDNLKHVYRSYVALGGNGVAKTLYQRVQDLPITQ